MASFAVVREVRLGGPVSALSRQSTALWRLAVPGTKRKKPGRIRKQRSKTLSCRVGGGCRPRLPGDVRSPAFLATYPPERFPQFPGGGTNPIQKGSMPGISLESHRDDRPILLAEPYELRPNAQAAVTVVTPAPAANREHWRSLGAMASRASMARKRRNTASTT